MVQDDSAIFNAAHIDFTTSVAIILPVHLRHDHIRARCINSISAQVYPHRYITLLICLNGLPLNDFDSFVSYVLEQCHDFCSIKFIYVPENCSPGRARNTLIRNSRHDFFLILDSDDFLNPYSIYHKIAIASTMNVDVVFSNAYEFSHIHSRICGKRFYKSIHLCLEWSSLLKKIVNYSINLFPNSGTLLSQRCFRDHRFPELFHEDFAFYHDLLFVSGFRYYVSSYPCVYYGVSYGSLTGNKFKSRLYHYHLLREYFQLPFFAAVVATSIGVVLLVFLRMSWKIRFYCCNFSVDYLLGWDS